MTELRGRGWFVEGGDSGSHRTADTAPKKPRTDDLSCEDGLSSFPACSGRAENPRRQPPAPGLQTPGAHRAGQGLRREERHDLLRGESPVQLQRHRVVHGAVAHRPDEARHGEVLEAQQR